MTYWWCVLSWWSGTVSLLIECSPRSLKISTAAFTLLLEFAALKLVNLSFWILLIGLIRPDLTPNMEFTLCWLAPMELWTSAAGLSGAIRFGLAASFRTNGLETKSRRPFATCRRWLIVLSSLPPSCINTRLLCLKSRWMLRISAFLKVFRLQNRKGWVYILDACLHSFQSIPSEVSVPNWVL